MVGFNSIWNMKYKQKIVKVRNCAENPNYVLFFVLLQNTFCKIPKYLKYELSTIKWKTENATCSEQFQNPFEKSQKQRLDRKVLFG